MTFKLFFTDAEADRVLNLAGLLPAAVMAGLVSPVYRDAEGVYYFEPAAVATAVRAWADDLEAACRALEAAQNAPAGDDSPGAPPEAHVRLADAALTSETQASRAGAVATSEPHTGCPDAAVTAAPRAVEPDATDQATTTRAPGPPKSPLLGTLWSDLFPPGCPVS